MFAWWIVVSLSFLFEGITVAGIVVASVVNGGGIDGGVVVAGVVKDRSSE